MNFTQSSRGQAVKVISVGDFGSAEILDDFSATALIALNGSVSEDDLLRDGDLLFVRSNGNKALIGRCVYVRPGNERVSFSGFTIRARIMNPSVDPWFVSKVVRSHLFKESLHRLGGGSSISNLNQGVLAGFEFPLPPLEEQHRIVEVIRTWDEAIEKCDQLINGKEKLRNQLKNDLISWARWPKIRIGDVVVAVTRPVPTPKSAYNALSIRSHGKGTFHRRIERPEEIGMETVYEVGPRDLIVNITFAWEGAIALAKPEDAGFYVSHRFPTFEVDENVINREFLGYAVCTRRLIHFLGIASPGGAGRNRVLNKSDFLDLEIPFPPKAEQDRAASILLGADREISLLQSMRDALAKQKRGLMHKLLAGEWRLTADAEVVA